MTTTSNPRFALRSLGLHWPTRDPFLFCAHHLDHYPKGNAALGPDASLAGRHIGMDFELKDGFRMYHGDRVPGFPAHPHRGFETITLARQGYIDHSDSLGATARFGHGDIQWMTAGKGIVHCEMFPLVKTDAPNPCELFQLWLNLPARSKMVDPHFSMMWAPSIPKLQVKDDEGKITELTLIAGKYGDTSAPTPPPASWAASAEADIAVWTLRMEPGAHFTIPAAEPGSLRSVYFFEGESITADGTKIDRTAGLEMADAEALELRNGNAPAELLLLQGRPIGEPVAQHGPFVMNTRDELIQAFQDYQRTQFGGWPWQGADPVHPRDEGRFAKRPDGSVTRPEPV